MRHVAVNSAPCVGIAVRGGLYYESMYVCLSPHARTHHTSSRTHASCQATASVDLKTDDFVQQTIRTQLKHCSIITIAHRLLTVIDYDRICVMNAGTVAEYDSPHALRQRSPRLPRCVGQSSRPIES